MFIFVINRPSQKALDVKLSQLWSMFPVSIAFWYNMKAKRCYFLWQKKKADEERKSQEPCRLTQGKTHTRRNTYFQSFLKKINIAIFSTAVFLQFLLIPWPYTPNFSCGQNLTHNWCPQLVLLHYFAIKVMFKAFYWKHFSIILYGKSQTVLIISWGECSSISGHL